MSSMNVSLLDVFDRKSPSGAISNFDNFESKVVLTIVTIIVSLALMLIFFALRIYSRFRHRCSFDGSDCKYQMMNEESYVDRLTDSCVLAMVDIIYLSLRQCSRVSNYSYVSFLSSLS